MKLPCHPATQMEFNSMASTARLTGPPGFCPERPPLAWQKAVWWGTSALCGRCGKEFSMRVP